jgi:hypothetical protein
MTDGHAVPVDLDLLADYGCGALAGTADESRVAALIDADPAWAMAYSAVTAADPLVRADLAELGDTPEPMPADVLHRVLAALPTEPEQQPATVRELPRRRRYRTWAWAAAAAAVVVLAGIGLTVGLRNTGGTSGSLDAASAGRPSGTPTSSGPEVMGKQSGPDDQPNPEKVLLTASGADYTRATLPRVPAAAGARTALSSGQLTGVPAALSRLTDMSELNLCLRAVAAVRPGTAQLVDYARFEGSPALIVVLDGGTVVAGPSCGRNGADIRYQTGQ